MKIKIKKKEIVVDENAMAGSAVAGFAGGSIGGLQPWAQAQ